MGIPGRTDDRLLPPQDGAGLRKEQVWPPLMLLGITCLVFLPAGLEYPEDKLIQSLFDLLLWAPTFFLGAILDPKGVFKLWHLQSLHFVPWMGANCHVLVYLHSFLQSHICKHYSRRIVGFIGFFSGLLAFGVGVVVAEQITGLDFESEPLIGKGKQSC